MNMRSKKETELYREIRELRDELRTTKDELRVAKLMHGELSNDDQSWLQMKVASQRKALDKLNRKVLSQRFRLRVLNEKGRDLTKEEYLEAKDALENEQVKERIEEYAPVA